MTFFRIYHGKERWLQDDPRVLLIGFEGNSQQFSVGLVIQINKIMVEYKFREYPRENLQLQRKRENSSFSTVQLFHRRSYIKGIGRQSAINLSCIHLSYVCIGTLIAGNPVRCRLW